VKFIDDAIKESEKRLEDKRPNERIHSDLDEELLSFIDEGGNGYQTKILVIGAGGSGNNTITRLNDVGVDGVETIAINTDAQDLFYTQSLKKILIGKTVCKGKGAGGKPELGEDSAEESKGEIKSEIENTDMVFIACGLGGGTGTGSAPIIAKLAKKAGALTVAVVTMPFSSEGINRMKNADKGLQKLQENCDSVIVVPNDKLLEIANNMPLEKAFYVADEILVRAVKGITELITKPCLLNLDFADVRTIMEGAGMAMIGMGESDTGDRALESVHEALNSPLLDLDPSNAKGALINVSGSSDLTLHEAEKIVQIVADKLDSEANIIWGAQIDDSLQSTVRTTIVVSGVKSSNLSLNPADDNLNRIEISENHSTEVDPLEDLIDGIF